MGNKVKSAYRVFCNRLIDFYPKDFRERFGESMQQTFDDLYIEQSKHTRRGSLGFVLSIFADATISILREHAMKTMERSNMNNAILELKAAAIIGFLLMIPFAILELTLANYSSFPFAVFTVLWLLPAAFIVLLMPLLRFAQTGNAIPTNPARVLIRVLFLSLITFVWAGLLIDQMPCFLGVPNCD